MGWWTPWGGAEPQPKQAPSTPDGDLVYVGEGPPPFEIEDADTGDFYVDLLTGDLYELH
jgi:hypothetical protein